MAIAWHCAGADTIEHMVFHDPEVIDMIVDSNVWMTPTLLHRTDHAIQNRLDQGTSQFVINKMKALQPYCFETFQKDAQGRCENCHGHRHGV